MKPKFQTAFFGVDSTIVSIEGMDILGPSDPEIGQLNDAAMNGEMSFADAYARTLSLVRPNVARVQELATRYRESLLPDAKEVVRTLLDAGVDVHLVTSGVQQAVELLAAELGIPARATHAVRLLFDATGEYVDFDRRSLLTRAGGKELVVLSVRSRSHGKAFFVGGGMTDLEAREAVDLFIGFGGVRISERVRQASPVYITEPRLSAIIPHVMEVAG
ncbi:MAG: HAD-IB family phosphatase [Thermoanaerobaculia bacterium]